MVTRSCLRLFLPVLLICVLCRTALGAEDMGGAMSVQYKRADANFYPRGDVLKADPGAVILSPTELAQNGDTYTYTPRKKAPKTIYIETPVDWVEPITPPDMPASLNIAPDEMQIREAQGDVQVAMPSAPTVFSPATNGMSLPNGAVVKTGANATAAILFGGVSSARLMPNSEAAVQQAVATTSRAAEVDLTEGGVFSKVGTQLGVGNDYQVHTPFGTALTSAGDFAAYTTGDRTDIWVEQGTVDLLQPDGKKYGTATGLGSGPLKLIRFPAIANAAKSQEADDESLTAILNFLPMADQKLAALHAKEAQNVALSANEKMYLARIKQVPALIKLAVVVPPPSELTVLADGTVGFQGQTLSLIELKVRLKDFVARTYDPAVVVMAGNGATYANFAAVMQACKEAAVPHVTTEGTLPEKPAPPPPPPAPPAPPQALTVIAHADGSIKFEGATMAIDDFRQKIQAAETAHPDAPVILHSNPKMDYAKFSAVLEACKSNAATQVTVVQPAPQPPPPAPVPPPPTSPAPAVTLAPVPPPTPPAPPKPLPVIARADGTIKFQGKTMKIDEFTAKIQAAAAANPDLAVILHSNPKMDYAKFKAVLDACQNAPVKNVDVVQPAPVEPAAATAEAPTTNAAPVAPPLPETAETPPAPVNTAAVPAEIDLAADGSLMLDGAAITEDALKDKLADIKKTNPKNPLVMMKQPGVTKAEWTHYVDLAHEAGLKLLVRNAKAAAMTSPAPVLRPAAAEGGPIAEPATLAPHLSVTPTPVPEETGTATEASAPISQSEEAVPVEIELTPDGQVSFLGEAISESELKERLQTVAQSNAKEPVLIVKDEKVAHSQWQHVVDLCHAAKLKVKLKTVKSSDSTALKPRVQPSVALAPAPMLDGAGTAGAAPRILPVEIDLASKGRLTFEGESITLDELKSRLGTIAQGNPEQPVVIVKQSDVSNDSANALETICQGISPKLRVSVKAAPDFTPTLPFNAPAENLPAPTVHMHISLEALRNSTASTGP